MVVEKKGGYMMKKGKMLFIGFGLHQLKMDQNSMNFKIRCRGVNHFVRYRKVDIRAIGIGNTHITFTAKLYLKYCK